jgi:hypothetical protein
MYLSLLLLITCLFFPVLWYIISRSKWVQRWRKILYIFFSIEIIHLFLFYRGISFRWDYIDYTLFSIDYLLFCIWVYGAKPRHILLRICRWSLIFITGVWTLIWAITTPSILFLSNDFEVHSKYQYQQDWDTFEVRRYITGDATTSNSIYTTDTYKLFGKLPFELHIHQVVEDEDMESK